MLRTAIHNQRSASPPRRRGVVIIIVLLAIILLTALVLFVLNLGQQVNRRVNAQNTADATVAAGSTWVARSFNTVARNNVHMSRYIGLVNVLDALPQAVHFSRLEQTSMRDALQAQLARGVSNYGPASLNNELEAMLDGFLGELNDELDQIIPVDDMLQSLDMTAVTHYQGPDGMGDLWRGMVALDEINQSVMTELPTMMQAVAVDGGQMTLHAERDAEAFVVPVATQIPWERGSFADFRHPVRYGTLPDDVDDPLTNRGPYDTIFGWHDLIDSRTGGTYVPGDTHTASGGSGNVPIGRGPDNSGRWIDVTNEVTAYYTWGTHGHLLRRVRHFVDHELRNSRLDAWTRAIANAKRDYIWPGDADPNTDDEIDPVVIELDNVVEPDWILDFNEALHIAQSDPERIQETGFIAVELKSRYPIGHPGFMSDGSWAPIERWRRWQPHIVRVNGWEDPRSWEGANVIKSVDHGWRDTWNGTDPSYTVWHDHEIGIDPLVDDQGNPVAQPVYRIDHFYFAGVNVGEEQGVTNPYEGFDPYADDAPAPIDFDHAEVSDTEAGRREHLTFLAVALQHDRAQAWPSRFTGAKPFPAQVALAQAKVFNNHSWDLWTQMWHAQLEPITDLPAWTARMEADADLLPLVPDIDSERYTQLIQYMSNSQALGEVMVEH